MKKLITFCCAIAILAFFFFKVTYHGNKTIPTPKPENQVDVAKVVSEARKLTGKMYDPLQGGVGNILGKMGFIVCIDVPVLSYQNAGYSIKRTLIADFKKHPSYYDTREDNNPGNPFFHRRAKNLYLYCKVNGRLIDVKQGPEVGDVVFYKSGTERYPSHVALVSKVDPEGYWVIESTAVTILSKELDHKDIEARGYTTMGFGRIIMNLRR